MEDLTICKNCVMDSSDSLIIFDHKGVCDHCKTFYSDILPVWMNGENKERELNQILSHLKKIRKHLRDVGEKK